MNPLQSSYKPSPNQLLEEITNYLTYITLTPQESQLYQKTFETLKQKIISFYAPARVFLTGSLASNLATYGTDLDLMVPNLKIGQIRTALAEFPCELINCTHPIVSGSLNNVNFDVSCAGISVLNDVEMNKKLSENARKLIFLMKQVMRSQSKGVLREGGISSHLMLQLIRGYFGAKGENGDISEIFVKFCKFYKKFDSQKQQITEGEIVEKSYQFKYNKSFPDRQEPQIVIISNGVEIGGAITDWAGIQAIFAKCYKALKKNDGKVDNMLRQVISVDEAAEDMRSKIIKIDERKADEK